VIQLPPVLSMKVKRRAAALARAVVPLAALAFAPPRAMRPEPVPDPILFVHGWQGEAAQWRPMLARFRRDGWRDARLFAWTFDDREPNEAIAARISTRVDQILEIASAGGLHDAAIVTLRQDENRPHTSASSR